MAISQKEYYTIELQSIGRGKNIYISQLYVLEKLLKDKKIDVIRVIVLMCEFRQDETMFRDRGVNGDVAPSTRMIEIRKRKMVRK